MKWFFDPCRHHRRNLSLLAAGVLSEAEKDPLAIHLAACADCRQYFGELKTVAAPLADWAENLSQIQLGESTRQRWTQAIRRSAVAAVYNRRLVAEDSHKRRSQTAATIIWRVLWREVFWPWRRVWAGLAAVWLVILAGNVSLREPSPVIVSKSAAPSEEAVNSFRDQQKILAELLPGNSAPRDAGPQRFISPKPRTQIEHILSA